jgi:hypothetical protein
MHFDRFDICAAYNMYGLLWDSGRKYSAALHRLKYRPAHSEEYLEGLSENAKEIYGALVRKHERIFVAWERYAKRNRNAPSWPGTFNMPGQDPYAWLKSQGLLSAVESMVP